MKSYLIILSFCLFYSGRSIYPITIDDFLNSDIGSRRNTHEGNVALLSEVSNEISLDSNKYELFWECSALWYTEGQLYATNRESKKYCFSNVKDNALIAVKLNPSGPEGHYWLGVGYGLWSEANGILDSLFYAGDILNEMTAVIELQPDFFHGEAWAIRAKVYDYAPGWPISIGDKTKAYEDLKMAMKYGSNYRFILQTDVEILMNDGKYKEAREAAEKALTLPYDSRIPKEEDQGIAALSNYLIIINSALK